MNLGDRLRSLAESLPSESSSVTLSRRDLLDLLEDECESGSDQANAEEPLMDLSVADIMAGTGRARSTVIGWIRNEGLEAYWFGREHRVTRAAWRSFLDKRRSAKPKEEPRRSRDTADLGSWRRLKAGQK